MSERSELHHLESASVYAEGMERRAVPSIPNDELFNISTPKYEMPKINLIDKPSNEMIYGGLLPLPKPFNEPLEPQTWLNEYEDIADGNNWDDQMKFRRVFACLEGGSKQWYSNEKRSNPDFNWQLFKEGLVSKFRNKCNPLMSEIIIQNRKQGKGESLNSYWQDKIHLITIYDPEMPTKSQMTNLFNGLEPSLKSRIVKKFVDETPPNVKELYEMVKSEYDSSAFAGVSTRKVRFEGEGENEEAAKPKETKQALETPRQKSDPMLKNLMYRMDSLTNEVRKMASQQYSRPPRPMGSTATPGDQAVRTQSTTSRPQLTARNLDSVQCWFCNGFGHYANKCPKKENPNHTKNYLRQN